MSAPAFLALVDTNDLAEAFENLIPFLIVSTVVLIVGSVVLIRMSAKLAQRATATSRGRQVIRALILVVFVAGAVMYMVTVSYDLKTVLILGVITAIVGPALVTVTKLLGAAEDDVPTHPGSLDGDPDEQTPSDPFFR